MDIEFIKGFFVGVGLLIIVDILYYIKQLQLKKQYDKRLHKIEQNVEKLFRQNIRRESKWMRRDLMKNIN